MPQAVKYGIRYFYLQNDDESKKALKIISGTMIVLGQMFEQTHKLIAFQPAEFLEKSERKCVCNQGNFDQRHLENQHGDPQFFFHILIENGLKNVSIKFEQNRIGFENSLNLQRTSSKEDHR